MSLHSRWTEVAGHIHERHPELKPGTVRLLAARPAVGYFGLSALFEHLRRKRNIAAHRVEQRVAIIAALRHAEQRANNVQDPEAQRLLRELVALREELYRAHCARSAAPERSQCGTENAILE